MFGFDIALKTIDGGNSWLIQNMNNSVSGGYRNSYFINETTGFVTGEKGKIYKTESAGTFIQSISSEIPDDFRITKAYPNPFNSQVNVVVEVPQRLSNQNEFVYEVYDIRGSLVRSENFLVSTSGIYKLSLDLNGLNTGMYLIRIKKGDLITPPQKLIYLK